MITAKLHGRTPGYHLSRGVPAIEIGIAIENSGKSIPIPIAISIPMTSTPRLVQFWPPYDACGLSAAISTAWQMGR
jgi:hypothetical protein